VHQEPTFNLNSDGISNVLYDTAEPDTFTSHLQALSKWLKSRSIKPTGNSKIASVENYLSKSC